MSFDVSELDTFDKETAEAWLKIEKKKRKTLAKTKHPAKAIADEVAKALKGKEKEDALQLPAGNEAPQ